MNENNSACEADPTLTHLHEAWSKCCFCGAKNGKFGRPLQQHKTRCRYKGNANSFDLSVPNYFKMIEEDDPAFLAGMSAITQVIILKNKLAKANVQLAEKKDETK